MRTEDNLILYELDRFTQSTCPKCGNNYTRNFFYSNGEYIVGYKVICNECEYMKEKII